MKCTGSIHPRRTGFLLLEMLIAIGLLAVVGLLATQIAGSIFRTWRESAAQQAVQGRFDQAMRQLRTDVWDASGIERPGPHTVRIRSADGHTVDWQTDGSAGRISRTSGDDPVGQHWDSLGTLTFRAQGPTLVVDIASGPQEPGGRIVLMSQPMLLVGRSQ